MAEVNIIGMLIGASDFPSSTLTCKYQITAGDDWKLLEGDEVGQTHVDLPEDPRLTVWSHPIGVALFLWTGISVIANYVDVHYATNTVQGWPKVIVQVYHQDTFGRNELYGYGFVHIPTAPGKHLLEIVTWRPVGSYRDQLYAYFLGATPQLKNIDMITNPADRFRLETMTMGKVYVEISLVTRNFEISGVVV